MMILLFTMLSGLGHCAIQSGYSLSGELLQYCWSRESHQNDDCLNLRFHWVFDPSEDIKTRKAQRGLLWRTFSRHYSSKSDEVSLPTPLSKHCDHVGEYATEPILFQSLRERCDSHHTGKPFNRETVAVMQALVAYADLVERSNVGEIKVSKLFSLLMDNIHVDWVTDSARMLKRFTDFVGFPKQLSADDQRGWNWFGAISPSRPESSPYPIVAELQAAIPELFSSSFPDVSARLMDIAFGLDREGVAAFVLALIKHLKRRVSQSSADPGRLSDIFDDPQQMNAVWVETASLFAAQRQLVLKYLAEPSQTILEIAILVFGDDYRLYWRERRLRGIAEQMLQSSRGEKEEEDLVYSEREFLRRFPGLGSLTDEVTQEFLTRRANQIVKFIQDKRKKHAVVHEFVAKTVLADTVFSDKTDNMRVGAALGVANVFDTLFDDDWSEDTNCDEMYQLVGLHDCGFLFFIFKEENSIPLELATRFVDAGLNLGLPGLLALSGAVARQPRLSVANTLKLAESIYLSRRPFFEEHLTSSWSHQARSKSTRLQITRTDPGIGGDSFLSFKIDETCVETFSYNPDDYLMERIDLELLAQILSASHRKNTFTFIPCSPPLPVGDAKLEVSASTLESFEPVRNSGRIDCDDVYCFVGCHVAAGLGITQMTRRGTDSSAMVGERRVGISSAKEKIELECRYMSQSYALIRSAAHRVYMTQFEHTIIEEEETGCQELLWNIKADDATASSEILRSAGFSICNIPNRSTIYESHFLELYNNAFFVKANVIQRPASKDTVLSCELKKRYAVEASSVAFMSQRTIPGSHAITWSEDVLVRECYYSAILRDLLNRDAFHRKDFETPTIFTVKEQRGDIVFATDGWLVAEITSNDGCTLKISQFDSPISVERKKMLRSTHNSQICGDLIPKDATANQYATLEQSPYFKCYSEEKLVQVTCNFQLVDGKGIRLTRSSNWSEFKNPFVQRYIRGGCQVIDVYTYNQLIGECHNMLLVYLQ